MKRILLLGLLIVAGVISTSSIASASKTEFGRLAFFHHRSPSHHGR